MALIVSPSSDQTLSILAAVAGTQNNALVNLANTGYCFWLVLIDCVLSQNKPQTDLLNVVSCHLNETLPISTEKYHYLEMFEA